MMFIQNYAPSHESKFSRLDTKGLKGDWIMTSSPYSTPTKNYWALQKCKRYQDG